jgi:hypothetical protein
MRKRLSNEEITINKITSELESLLMEHELERLTKEDIFSSIGNMLIDGGVSSEIVVKVFERCSFGTEGLEAARNIKVREGW